MSQEEIETAKRAAELDRVAFRIAIQRLDAVEKRQTDTDRRLDELARFVGYQERRDYPGRDLPGVPRDQRPHA